MLPENRIQREARPAKLIGYSGASSYTLLIIYFNLTYGLTQHFILCKGRNNYTSPIGYVHYSHNSNLHQRLLVYFLTFTNHRDRIAEAFCLASAPLSQHENHCSVMECRLWADRSIRPAKPFVPPVAVSQPASCLCQWINPSRFFTFQFVCAEIVPDCLQHARSLYVSRRDYHQRDHRTASVIAMATNLC